MLESISSAVADISLPQLAVIACMALFASVVGGVSGYGTGALLPIALPTTILGAWIYTLLSGRGVALLIGSVLIASVPARRFFKSRGFSLSDRGLTATSFGWGMLAGGTSGAGIMLLSMLMA